MKNFIVIENIFSFPKWNATLDHALEMADRFGVVFPDGEYDEENPLLRGKPDFEDLPNLLKEPWPGMKDASIYSGDLTEKAKMLIKEYTDIDSANHNGTIWNFSLFRNGKELLNIQDFDVCLVDAETELTVHLDGLKIIRSATLE